MNRGGVEDRANAGFITEAESEEIELRSAKLRWAESNPLDRELSILVDMCSSRGDDDKLDEAFDELERLRTIERHAKSVIKWCDDHPPTAEDLWCVQQLRNALKDIKE